MPAIASKSFKAGEVIFEFNSIIHCIENDSKGRHCDNCLRFSLSLKRCSKCLKMYYCDKKCQINDWKYHKNECKVFKDNNLHSLTTVLFKIILRLYLCTEKDSEMATKRYPLINGSDICLNDIETETELLMKLEKEKMYFETTCNHFDAYKLKYDRQRLLRCYALVDVLRLSALHYYPDDPFQVHMGWYSEGVASALFVQKPNLMHSCLPNAGLVKNGMTYQYRAMKDITKGEEITEGFIDLGNERHIRRADLLSHNYTVCKCDKCRLHLDKDIDYEHYRLLAAINENYIRKVGDICAPLINSMYKLNENLFDFYRELYGQNDVFNNEKLVLSFICFARYSIHRNKSLVEKWYKLIEPSLLITHGSDHPTYRLLRKTYDLFKNC